MSKFYLKILLYIVIIKKKKNLTHFSFVHLVLQKHNIYKIVLILEDIWYGKIHQYQGWYDHVLN